MVFFMTQHIVRLSTFFVLFLVCGQLVLNAQPRPRYDDIGIPGITKPKPDVVKPPKIKYRLHEGSAKLKSGLILHGKFKFQPSSNDVPHYVFMERGSSKRKKVDLSMIESMTLAGAEKGISARSDSTEFVWIDKFKDLYRKVRIGTIEVYDNSRIVNEKYEYLTEYVLLTGRQDYGYKIVKQLSDLELIMSDRPYFMQSAKATGRYETRDFRVIIYLIDLFNSPNSIDVLKWEPMSITLKKGKKVLRGKGYIQPMDLREEYVPSSNAYIHFHDGKDFQLLTQRDVKKVVVDGVPYKEGSYTVSNHYFYGKPWIYNGSNYLIIKRIVNSNTYFFKSNSLMQSTLIMKEVAGSYVRASNEMELKTKYMEEERSKQKAQKD